MGCIGTGQGELRHGLNHWLRRVSRLRNVPFNELLEGLPARERRLFHGDEETLKKDVAESIHAIEAV